MTERLSALHRLQSTSVRKQHQLLSRSSSSSLCQDAPSGMLVQEPSHTGSGKLQPSTPHEHDCQQDQGVALRSASTSGASTSTCCVGSQRKRKTISRSSSAGLAKQKTLDSQLSGTCDSSKSSHDYMVSWSQSYAASTDMRSGASLQSAPEACLLRHSCDLFCQEMAVEDEPQTCMTGYSSQSQDSTQSETWGCEGTPMTICGDGDYPEDPPAANDLDMYELPEVHPSSLSHSLAKVYGFSTHVIAFGTSYFQRLAACDSLLLPAALTCPDFAPFVQGIVLQEDKVLPCSVGHPTHSFQSAKIYCMAVHLTCIYLAAKSVELVPYKRLLQTMLTHVHERAVSTEQAAALEMQVIQGLDWRLSPYFLTPRREHMRRQGEEVDFCMAW